MNRAIKLGSVRTDGWLILLAAVCAAVLCIFAPSAFAQAPNSSSANPPGLNTQPQVPPPASAPVPAAPATPSMMPSVPGTELDRVVAIVNDDLVLDSDVNEELRIQAFDPYHTSSEKLSGDRALERLINRALILQQLKLQSEDEPSDAEVNKEIDQLRRDIPACSQYHCETKEGWDRFLAENGFTETSFFARWKERMDVLSFIEDRFQLGINITPQQIQTYYDKTLLPEYARQHAPAPKLNTITKQIREVLLQQQISNLLQDWLQSLRAQGSVVVLHPGEEAP
jgi:parvulin-like peptidyl-prolyl isomerase